MVIFSALIFSGQRWVAPAAVVAALSIVLLAWNYFFPAADRRLRLLCFVLKLVGILLLLGCLLEPLWDGTRVRPGANFFAIVADNSQGLQIKDLGETRTRGEIMRDWLFGKEAAWNSDLSDFFQVRRYLFDSRLQSTADFADLNFEGRSSAIGGSLKALRERFQGQPLAGVFLFTDGNATDLPGGTFDTAGLPPIYPVVVGNDDAVKDVGIQKTTVSQSSFEDAPVSIQTTVAASGYAGDQILVQLFDQSGKKVQESAQTPRKNEDSLEFRFQFKPEKNGLSFYRLRASAQGELAQFDDPKKSVEATLANNQAMVAVDRGNAVRRILYVAGRPDWEFKFLNRAISDEEQLQMVALIRVAPREAKFDFRGNSGDQSNPLYQGFDKKDDAVSYDKAVMVRLNTKDALELKEGFPKTAEELYAYDAIVLTKIESDFFTRDQLALMEKFVSERGGGFLSLGGAESFREGNYEHTPIADMLPVYLNHTPDETTSENFKLNLTREGWLQPWARLRPTESEEQSRLASMSTFGVINRIRDVKPGASVIATIADEHGKIFPALAVQRFGNGRSGALLVGDMWRWGFHDEAAHRDLDKSWRQMMRWLVTDVPNRVELSAETTAGENGDVPLQVKVRDKKYQAMDNAIVNLTVQVVPASGAPSSTNSSVKINAEASPTQAGVFTGSYAPREAAGYRAQAIVTDMTGAEIGRSEVGWTSDPAAEEFRSLKPNRSFLQSLAAKTGGEVVAAKSLSTFVKDLKRRKAPVTENWSYPLWHTPAIFLAALVCFAAEWGLRRWKGMA